MAKFPIDAPKRKVVKALEELGFYLVREKNPYDFEEPESISKESIVLIKNAAYPVTMPRAV